MAFKKELIESVSKEELKEVLKGHVRSLVFAFTWRHTPREPSYWEDRCYSKKPLTKADMKFLRDLLKAS